MTFDKNSNATKEQISQYNSLVETLNGIEKQGESIVSNYNKEASANASVLTSFEGDYGVDLAVGTINNKFKLSDDAEAFREKYAGDGFWNATADIVGGDLVQGLYQTFKKGTVGATTWVLSSFGDVFQDQDNYSSFDAFSDVVDQWSNQTLVPSSTDQKFDITKEKGGFKDFEARNYAKLGVSMVPFTAYLISEVKKGNFKGLKEAVGNTYMKLGAKGKVLAPASQKLKDNIIMMDATFRATIMDNQKEGEKLGLNGLQATSYATVKSSTEALVQMIMPDTQFLKGIEGKAIKDVFVGSLKKAATKEGFKTAGKQYLTNIGKELGEEELNAGANLVTDAAYGLALPKASEFMNNQIELVAGTLMLSGGMGISGAAKTFNNQKKLIYNQIHGNIASVDLQLTTMAQKVKDPETKKQLSEARQFALDVSNAVESSPENVTADQIDLLVQKKKLIEKKSKTDSSFHGPINERIKAIDGEIQSSLISTTVDKNLADNIKLAGEITEKLGFTEAPVVYETTEEYLEAVKNDPDAKKAGGGDAAGSEGVFIGKGKIFIDKQRARRVSAVSVGTHEVLHPILNALVGDKKSQGILIKDFKKSLSQDQINYVQDQLNKNVEKSEHDAEFINYFSDGIITVSYTHLTLPTNREV